MTPGTTQEKVANDDMSVVHRARHRERYLQVIEREPETGPALRDVQLDIKRMLAQIIATYLQTMNVGEETNESPSE